MYVRMYVFMLYYSRIYIKLDFSTFVDTYVQEAVTNGDEMKKPKGSKQEVCLCVRDTSLTLDVVNCVRPFIATWFVRRCTFICSALRSHKTVSFLCSFCVYGILLLMSLLGGKEERTGCVYVHSLLVFISFRYFIVVFLYPTLMYTGTTRFVHAVSCT